VGGLVVPELWRPESPDHARAVRALVGLSEREMKEMEEALTRLRPSPDIRTTGRNPDEPEA
jgi:hypothetical protein